MHENIQIGIIPALAIAFVVWGLVSAKLGRWNISGPIAFVVIGGVLGAGADPVLDLTLESESVLVLTELTLAVVLFGDAATVPLRRLRDDAGLPSRLLLLGLPLTMALGTLLAHLLFPDLSWWVCAVIGAAVAPTDAALGAAIMEDERVPLRIRRLLNVESGLNDGIATPIVNYFLVAAVAGTALETDSTGSALAELAAGALIGAVIGAVGGRGLEVARRHNWAEGSFVPIATGAISISSYAVAVAGHGNGFVAAFIAGLAFRAAHRQAMDPETLQFTHQGGRILSLSVWFVFGALIVPILDDLTWREVLFAVGALTVVRMAPVAAALVRTGLDRSTVVVVGWFGPRGLASVVFALLAADMLHPEDSEQVLLAIGATVLLSVVLHGATAAPIATRYGASHRDLGDPRPT